MASIIFGSWDSLPRTINDSKERFKGAGLLANYLSTKLLNEYRKTVFSQSKSIGKRG